MKKSLCLAALCTLASMGAHADLKNVSATTLQSSSTEAIACTIIATGGPTYQGYKVLVAFSETNGGGNPTARVANLSQTLIYANDNWVGGAMTLNGQPVGSTEQVYPFYFNGVGRVPNRGTDAAMLMLFPPGEAVCMYSREESSGTLIPASLAMTDITSTIAGARSASSEDLSLLDRLLPRP